MTTFSETKEECWGWGALIGSNCVLVLTLCLARDMMRRLTRALFDLGLREGAPVRALVKTVALDEGAVGLAE